MSDDEQIFTQNPALSGARPELRCRGGKDAVEGMDAAAQHFAVEVGAVALLLVLPDGVPRAGHEGELAQIDARFEVRAGFAVEIEGQAESFGPVAQPLDISRTSDGSAGRARGEALRSWECVEYRLHVASIALGLSM